MDRNLFVPERTIKVKVLFIGDIVGRPGREAVFDHLFTLREKYSVDFCAANCENAAGGFGATRETLDELVRAGVDAFTTGNHVFSKKEIIPLLENNEYDIIRPANLPAADPGRGFMVCTAKNGEKIALINLLGRLYIDLPTENPFSVIDDIVEELSGVTPNIILDFHAEATSEKRAMAYYLDGRVSAVIGTHTHVQTADEAVLPKGAAYITDVGMCGARHSVLGAEINTALARFTTGVGRSFKLAEGERFFGALFIELDNSGKAVYIERICK